MPKKLLIAACHHVSQVELGRVAREIALYCSCLIAIQSLYACMKLSCPIILQNLNACSNFAALWQRNAFLFGLHTKDLHPHIGVQVCFSSNSRERVERKSKEFDKNNSKV